MEEASGTGIGISTAKYGSSDKSEKGSNGIERLRSASTSAFVRRFSQRIIDAGIYYPDEEINGELIVRLYKQGDPIAKISLEEHCDFLGHGIAGFINIFSPQKIVIGGGLSEAGDFYIQKVSEKARSYAIPDCAVNTQIIAAALGNKAGSIGAASLVFTQLSAPNLIKL